MLKQVGVSTSSEDLCQLDKGFLKNDTFSLLIGQIKFKVANKDYSFEQVLHYSTGVWYSYLLYAHQPKPQFICSTKRVYFAYDKLYLVLVVGLNSGV